MTLREDQIALLGRGELPWDLKVVWTVPPAGRARDVLAYIAFQEQVAANETMRTR